MNKKLVAVCTALVGLAGSTWLIYTAGGFLSTASPAGIAIGLALMGSGAVAVWLIANQIRFALRADRLLDRMVREGDARCFPEVAVAPSGRVDPVSAAEYRAKCRSAAAQSPDDWRLWFLLGGAHEMVRDHRGAAAALARAAQLERQG